jgi:hypothetical protein
MNMKRLLKEKNIELLVMGLVFCTLVIFKITGVIDCLWVWVFVPIWFPTIVLVFLATLSFLLAGIFQIMPKRRPKE